MHRGRRASCVGRLRRHRPRRHERRERGPRDKGIKVGLVRPITLWPFPDEGH